MNTVIVDIETVGEDFEKDFSDYEKEYFLKYADTEEEKEENKLKTALSPLTGKVVAIGYYFWEEKKGLVETVSQTVSPFEKENASFCFLVSEKELLHNFWQIMLKYPLLVTFNGRSFDIPFILIRSAINDIRPTRNLMPYRYDFKVHCDLADQMSFYGALRYPKTLHFFARAFHIKSPKEKMEGKEVTNYYNAGRHQEIAEYCFKDVVATAALYDYWQKYLKF